MKCNLYYKCENCKTETKESKKSYKEAFYDMSFLYKCGICGSTKLYKKITKLKKWEK